MGKHFYTDQLPGRAADVFGNDGFVNGLHLLQVQLPGQHNHIGPLGIKAQGLYVGNAQLRGDMHLQADFPAVQDAGHVGGDDGVHAGFLRQVQHAAGLVEFLAVQGDVQGEIGLEPIGAADAHHLGEVLRLEIVGGVGAHVQVADAEIDRIGTSFHGGGEAFEAPRRGHDFQFLRPHFTRSTRSSAKRLRTV